MVESAAMYAVGGGPQCGGGEARDARAGPGGALVRQCNACVAVASGLLFSQFSPHQPPSIVSYCGATGGPQPTFFFISTPDTLSLLHVQEDEIGTLEIRVCYVYNLRIYSPAL